MAAYKAIPDTFGKVHKRFLNADDLDRGHGRRLHRALRRHELPVEREQCDR